MQKKSESVTLSRRSFLKTSGVAAGVLGLSGAGMFAIDNWLSVTSATAAENDRTAFTFHPPNCGGRCSYICTVRDGKMIKMQPNTAWENPNYVRCCPRGLSEVQRIYSVDRIQTPLKRVGERGANDFKQISWDEALKEIHEVMQKSIDRYGPESILFAGNYVPEFLPTLLGAQIDDFQGVDIGIANGLDPTTGDFGWYGGTFFELEDLVHSKNIIVFSANPSETIITTVQFLFDAMEAGAKLTVIDPMFSVTAAKADKWIPINPGVDSALMLAMISEIINNKWYDEEYMLANTVSPYLIDEKTGAFIRQNGEVLEDDTCETNPYMVWDGVSKQAVPATTEGIEPVLEGSFTLESGKVNTVFTLLKENQKPYTTAWASPITGVPEKDIIELARAYACDGPACITSGWGGSDKVCNSDVNGHALSLLASITGNIGIHGGGVGIMGEQMVSHSIAAEFGGWTLPEEFAPADLEMSFTARREEPNKARVLINSGNVTQQHTGNLHKTNEWLKTLDFIVTIVPFYNEGTKWSDIVLPSCTNFETEYSYSRMITFRNHVLIQQKVIDPLYESKSDFAIELELAKIFGVDEYLPKTADELLEAKLISEDPMLAGITLEALTENNGIMRMNVPTDPFVGHLDQVYDTPSGKLEYYHEVSFADGQALPNYAAPNEISIDNELAEKYPLSFVQRHTRFHVHSQFMESAWIREIDPEPVIELSVKDAEERGLANGDIVEVFNDRGSCKVKVKIMNTMRPGTSSIHQGWYSGKMIEGHLQNLTNDYQEERQKIMTYGPVVPYNDTRVEVKKV